MPSIFLDAQASGAHFALGSCSKSKLLRILAGDETANGGSVARHGSVAYLGALVELDVRERPDLARKYGIAVVPTVLAVAADGEVLERLAP